MLNRIGLIILQAAGALSIVPYPFILLANIMSIAAPGHTLGTQMPFILLSIYPVIWIGLDVLAWRLLFRGSTAGAFALSSIPALATLIGVAFIATLGGNVNKMFSRQAEEKRSAVEATNPLLWTIMCTAGPILMPGVPVVPADQAIKAIDANPTLINVAVPPYGTPLRVAVQNAGAEFHSDGRMGDSKKDLVQIVRVLVAHGAKLGPPDLKFNLWPEFVLKRILFEGPVNTETENPLTWRLLHREYGKLFEISPEELPLLNKPTPLHGTPLNAVLMIGAPDLFEKLVNAGARLTPEEERDPANAVALAAMFEKFPGLERVYRR